MSARDFAMLALVKAFSFSIANLELGEEAIAIALRISLASGRHQLIGKSAHPNGFLEPTLRPGQAIARSVALVERSPSSTCGRTIRRRSVYFGSVLSLPSSRSHLSGTRASSSPSNLSKMSGDLLGSGAR